MDLEGEQHEELWKHWQTPNFDVAYVTENITNQFFVRMHNFTLPEYEETYDRLFKKPLERKMFLFEQPVDILKDNKGQYMVLGMFLFPGCVTPYVIGTIAYPSDDWVSWEKIEAKKLTVVGCSHLSPINKGRMFSYLFKERFAGDDTKTHSTLEYWLSNLIFMNALVLFMNQEAKRAVVDTNFVPIEEIKPKFRQDYHKRPKKLISVIYRRKYETLPPNIHEEESKGALFAVSAEERRTANSIVRKAMRRHVVGGHYRNVYYPSLKKHIRRWIDDYKRGHDEQQQTENVPKIVLLCR